MAFSHTITQGVQPSADGVSRTTSYSGSAEKKLTETVPVATDTRIEFTLDVSAVKSFYMVCDQAITIETNSGSAADNTLVLKAGVPYIWNSDSYDTFKFTTDITALFATNAASSATLEIRAIVDATP